MIKALIFDMNGVISDDEKLHEIAYKELLAENNIELKHEDYKRKYQGSPNDQNFQDIIDEYGLDLDAKEMTAAKTEKYLKLAEKELESVDGVGHAVKVFSEKYELALVSSSPREEVEMVLEKFALKKYFKVIITADDITKGKPDPEPYLLASEKLGIAPENCVVFEDSLNGIASAKAAGMRVVALSTTNSMLNLAAADADVIIDDFII